VENHGMLEAILHEEIESEAKPGMPATKTPLTCHRARAMYLRQVILGASPFSISSC